MGYNHFRDAVGQVIESWSVGAHRVVLVPPIVNSVRVCKCSAIDVPVVEIPWNISVIETPSMVTSVA